MNFVSNFSACALFRIYGLIFLFRVPSPPPPVAVVIEYFIFTLFNVERD